MVACGGDRAGAGGFVVMADPGAGAGVPLLRLSLAHLRAPESLPAGRPAAAVM